MSGPPRRGTSRPPQRKQSPRRPEPEDVPRRAAFDVLRAVSERDAYANLTLPALLRERVAYALPSAGGG